MEASVSVPVIMGRERSLGIGLNPDNIVTSIDQDSAAARAGVRLGDIVLGWQGPELEQLPRASPTPTATSSAAPNAGHAHIIESVQRRRSQSSLAPGLRPPENGDENAHYALAQATTLYRTDGPPARMHAYAPTRTIPNMLLEAGEVDLRLL